MTKIKATVIRIKDSAAFYLVDHWGNNYPFGEYEEKELLSLVGDNKYIKLDESLVYNSETGDFENP